jgi:LacI family transcriptional regulator
MAKKVKLTDIATAAGVSIATVDRVVNGRGGVTADKESAVLAAAQSLGLDRKLALQPTRTLRVAVLMQPPGNPFHALLRDGVEALRDLYQPLNLQLLIHHLDPNQPAETAARIRQLAGGHDGLILCAPESPQIAAALRAVSGKLPVVTLATDIPDSGRAAYIGPDDTRAGRVAADLMGVFLGPAGGEIVMMAGRLDIAGHRARAEGFRAALARWHPQCALVEVVETGETLDAPAAHLRRALRDRPGLRGIYLASVGSAGLVRCLEELGLSGQIRLITHELTPNRRALLAQRKLSAVIDQAPLTEVRLAGEAMARLLGRMPGTAQSISTEIRIYMPENC